MKNSFFLSILFTVILSTVPAHADLLSDGNLSQFKSIRVKTVLSTDTLILENDKEVHLIGLKAPELPEKKRIERDQYGFVVKDSDPTFSLENQAFEFVRVLLEDKLVRLEFDSEKYDKHNALLAYAFLVDDGTFVNAEILRQGFAHLSLRPPNMKYKTVLRAAYREARQEKRGLQAQ